MFRLTLVKNNQSRRYNITAIANKIRWDSDFTATVALDFEVAISDTRLFPVNPCDIGDVVVLTKDSTEIYRGVIIEEQRSGRNAIKYITYDFSWYLNQSTTVYQFNDISATAAINQILKDFGIQAGSILNMSTRVNKIYIEKTPGQIIQDIIDKVKAHEGYDINVEMREGKIYFEKRQDLLITGRFRLADNLGQSNILSAISDPKRTRSIEPMRNRIRLIVDDEETEYEVTAQEEDRVMIERYGLIEETIRIDAEDAAKSRQVTRMLLKRLAKVHETNTAKFFGDIRFKAGRLFDLVEPVTGINNRFIIVEANHQVEKQRHTMDLELALPSEVV